MATVPKTLQKVKQNDSHYSPLSTELVISLWKPIRSVRHDFPLICLKMVSRNVCCCIFPGIQMGLKKPWELFPAFLRNRSDIFILPVLRNLQ